MTTGFKNGTLSVYLKGEIDHHRAAEIRTEIDDAVRAYIPEYPVGDADDCAKMIHEFVPIARAILALSQLKMRSVGGEVELTNLTRPVEAVFRMANLEKIVTIRRDR